MPEPDVQPDGTSGSPPSPAVAPRERRRARTVFWIGLVLVLATAGGVYGYQQWWKRALGVSPLHILLVGIGDSQARAGALGAEALSILRVDPRSGRAVAVVVPSQLRVDGEELWGLMDRGGLAALRAGVTAATGLVIHHHVILDHLGFAGIVDSLGGVDVALEEPLHLPAQGSLPASDIRPGRRRLNGRAALAYLQSAPYADVEARMDRQVLLLEALLERALSDGLSLEQARRLGDRMRQEVTTDIPPERLGAVVLLLYRHAGDLRVERLPGQWSDGVWETDPVALEALFAEPQTEGVSDALSQSR